MRIVRDQGDHREIIVGHIALPSLSHILWGSYELVLSVSVYKFYSVKTQNIVYYSRTAFNKKPFKIFLCF